MDIIKGIEHEQMKNKVPKIAVGNTVKVHQRITEGKKSRIQVLEGTIIKIQNGGLNTTVTVRRISYGVGLEKTFLLHSPNIEKIELVRVGKARRAKLNYLRDRIGKSAKTKQVIGARIVDEEVEVKPLIPATTEEEDIEEVMEAPAEENAEETKTDDKKEEVKTEEKAEDKKDDKKEESDSKEEVKEDKEESKEETEEKKGDK